MIIHSENGYWMCCVLKCSAEPKGWGVRQDSSPHVKDEKKTKPNPNKKP